jgi:hypothetical protein
MAGQPGPSTCGLTWIKQAGGPTDPSHTGGTAMMICIKRAGRALD